MPQKDKNARAVQIVWEKGKCLLEMWLEMRMAVNISWTGHTETLTGSMTFLSVADTVSQGGIG